MWDYDFTLSEDLKTVNGGQITYTDTNGEISYGPFPAMFQYYLKRVDYGVEAAGDEQELADENENQEGNVIYYSG